MVDDIYNNEENNNIKRDNKIFNDFETMYNFWENNIKSNKPNRTT